MADEKLTGVVTDLHVIKSANKKEMAFFNLSGIEMIAFPNIFHKYSKLIKNGVNLTVYANKDNQLNRVKYIVCDVYLNED